jgi:uncharacterized protein (DUF302 family)
MLAPRLTSALIMFLALLLLPLGAAKASDDGIVRLKSAYDMSETIGRLKKDIADKGIMFFDEIDQSKLAADAGIKLAPSTLLVFGNPPLGTLFITADPDAGLDWPVRLLVYRTTRARSGSPIPTSPGSRTAMALRAGTRSSRWHLR